MGEPRCVETPPRVVDERADQFLIHEVVSHMTSRHRYQNANTAHTNEMLKELSERLQLEVRR